MTKLLTEEFIYKNGNPKLEHNICILGNNGGVGGAILAVLNDVARNKSAVLYEFINKSNIYIVDIDQEGEDYYKSFCKNIENQLIYNEFDIAYEKLMIDFLNKSKIEIIIDLAPEDSLMVLEYCNKLGIKYINTAIEVNAVYDDEENDPYSCAVRDRFLEEYRSKKTECTAIVGSGMNPGIVQWMAAEIYKKNFPKVPKGVFVVENDTSFYKDTSLLNPDNLYITWSPECFMDEAVLNLQMYMEKGKPIFLDKKYVYRAKFGDEMTFLGFLVPHEEVINMGRKFFQTGFIYKFNDHTMNQILNKTTKELMGSRIERIEPHRGEIIGTDNVGILMVYDDFEEWMYNPGKNEEVIAKYKVSATYWQVACGVYASLSSLILDRIPKGIHYVDDLLINNASVDCKWGTYLKDNMKEFHSGTNTPHEGLLSDRRMDDVKNVGMDTIIKAESFDGLFDVLFTEEKLQASDRKKLKDEDFGIPELRKYPLVDAGHARSAIRFYKSCPKQYRKPLAKKILTKAKEFGIEVRPSTQVYKNAQ